MQYLEWDGVPGQPYDLLYNVFASLEKIRAFNDDLEGDFFAFLLRQISYDDEAETSPWILLSIRWHWS